VSNQLFEFTVKVRRVDGCDLPDPMVGAYVNCYVAATEFQDAVRKGVAALTNRHYVFEDIRGDVREIPIESWSKYIAKAWPEFVEHFPLQEEIASLVEGSVVFFGPFCGFEDT